MRTSTQSSKALCIPKKRHRNLGHATLLVGSCRKKTDRGQRSVFPSGTPRFSPLILTHKGSALIWLVGDQASLHPRRIWSYSPDRACHSPLVCAAAPHQAFRVSAPSLSRATTSRRVSNWSSEEAHLNTILNQSNHRHISTDSLDREDSQLVASLEGDSSPTRPTGKTHPYSNPNTRFRRERARDLAHKRNFATDKSKM